MIPKIGTLFAGMAWAFLVFLCTGYVSFPGDAIANRVEVEVNKASRGAYSLELGDVSPWWIGMSTGDVKVFGKADREGVNPLLMLATDARASASPFSLLSRTPYVSGSVTLGLEGLLHYGIATGMDEAGESLQVVGVELDGDGFPLSELYALVPNAEGSASGKVDLKVDLDAASGMGKSDGEVVLRGRGLTLISPVIMDFPLGRDVEIDDLDLELDIKEGKAKISRGRIVSDIANINITGTLSLADTFNRSTMDLRIEVELDPSMAAMATMMKSAEVNGKLVWRCVGRVNAFAHSCKPGDRAARGKAAAAKRGKRARPAPKGLSVEEREKRREELQERLKKRREKRRSASRAKRPGRDGRGPGDGLEDQEDEEPIEEDEEIIEEDEEIIDEEEEDPSEEEEFVEEE